MAGASSLELSWMMTSHWREIKWLYQPLVRERLESMNPTIFNDVVLEINVNYTRLGHQDHQQQYNDFLGLSIPAKISKQIRRHTSLNPSICHQLSQDIVHYALQVYDDLTRSGVVIGVVSNTGLLISASMEVDEEALLRDLLGNMEMDSNECCSICLEKLLAGVKITPLPCSHIFHYNCIATWLKRNPTCPLCRFHIS